MAIAALPFLQRDARIPLQERAQAVAVASVPGGRLQVLHAEGFIGEVKKRLVAGIGGRRGFRRKGFLLSFFRSLFSKTRHFPDNIYRFG